MKCVKWEGKLPFVGSTITEYFESGMEFQQHENLLSFCHSQYRGLKVFFNPCVYPSPLMNGTNNGIELLRIELERVANNNGYILRCNGGNKTNRRLSRLCSSSCSGTTTKSCSYLSRLLTIRSLDKSIVLVLEFAVHWYFRDGLKMAKLKFKLIQIIHHERKKIKLI